MPLIRLSKNGSISIVCNCKSKEKKKKETGEFEGNEHDFVKKKIIINKGRCCVECDEYIREIRCRTRRRDIGDRWVSGREMCHREYPGPANQTIGRDPVAIRERLGSRCALWDRDGCR